MWNVHTNLHILIANVYVVHVIICNFQRNDIAMHYF